VNPNFTPGGAVRSYGGAQIFPWVSAAISGACAVVWLVALAGQASQPFWKTPLGRWMALRSDRFDLQSFLTHHLLHQNWLHLLLNVAAIVYSGRVLEKRWGSFRFLVFYVAAALIGGLTAYLVGLCLLHSVSKPEGAPASVSFGASGAALACLAAYTLVREDRRLGCLSERYLIWTGMVLGAVGLLFFDNTLRDSNPRLLPLLTPQIAGMAGGAGLTFAMEAWDRAGGWGSARRRGAQKIPDLEVRTRVDTLLEKISKDGIQSLSPEEQSFLRAASKHFRNPS